MEQDFKIPNRRKHAKIRKNIQILTWFLFLATFFYSRDAVMKEENPWNIESLYDFLFFNCPSCTYKNNSKQKFVDHAVKVHPESNHFLLNLKDSSINVNFVHEFLKCEFAAENFTTSENPTQEFKLEQDEFKPDDDEEMQNYDFSETYEYYDEAHDDLKEEEEYFGENDFTEINFKTEEYFFENDFMEKNHKQEVKKKQTTKKNKGPFCYSACCKNAG